MMCRVDGAERSPVFHASHPTARRSHECEDCGGTIERGEVYHHGTGLADGYWWSAKQCGRCEQAARWLTTMCGGWVWDEVTEDLAEHWNEDELCHSHAFGRLTLAAWDRWRLRGRTLTADEVRALVDAALARIPAPGRAT